MVNFTINDIELQVEEGKTILEVIYTNIWAGVFVTR